MFKINFLVTFIATLGVILSASYSIWLLNRISFGILRTYHIWKYQDVSRREFLILFNILILIFWLGIYPGSFLNELHFSVLNLLEHFF
jgi:NADH-quinone oxidoreductase subunit M